MPSFRRVLAAVADAWARRRDDARRQGDQVVQVLAAQAGALGGDGDGQLADDTLPRRSRGCGGRSTPPGAGSGPPPSSPSR